MPLSPEDQQILWRYAARVRNDARAKRKKERDLIQSRLNTEVQEYQDKLDRENAPIYAEAIKDQLAYENTVRMLALGKAISIASKQMADALIPAFQKAVQALSAFAEFVPKEKPKKWWQVG